MSESFQEPSQRSYQLTEHGSYVALAIFWSGNLEQTIDVCTLIVKEHWMYKAVKFMKTEESVMYFNCLTEDEDEEIRGIETSPIAIYDPTDL